MPEIRRIFLASSAELQDHRRDFEIFISRRNNDGIEQDRFLKLVIWEDFLDAFAKTRLQDKYNQEIRNCDIFVMLFRTKVGKYTEEEFETAVGGFRAKDRPFVFTFYHDDQAAIGKASADDLNSLRQFQDKLLALGHFQTVYRNSEELQLKFGQQLDKLAAGGFRTFTWDKSEAVLPSISVSRYTGHVEGSGGLAVGPHATATGAGSVMVGRDNTGPINTGTQVTHGTTQIYGANIPGGDFVGWDRTSQGLTGHDLDTLFARLLDAACTVPMEHQIQAVALVDALRQEVDKGRQAKDEKLGGLIEGFIALVPAGVGAVVALFASPILAELVGPVTAYVLDKLRNP